MFDQNRIHGAELSIADKIEAIERSKDLGELPAKFWPDSHSEKYLFITRPNTFTVLSIWPFLKMYFPRTASINKTFINF